MPELTFLEEQQIFGDKALDIIKKRGTKAAITDFAILLGGYFNDNFYIGNSKSLDKRTGYYWTKTDDGDNDVRVVFIGDSDNRNVRHRNGGARPASPFSSISSIPTNEVSGVKKDGVLEIEYGYYPKSAVSYRMQMELEQAYEKRNLINTGNIYTTDSRNYDEYDEKFFPQSHYEYEYNGKKYVRVEANSYYDGDEFTLSNGEQYKDGDYVWVEVEPVKWLVDEKAKIMITEEIIFAGVQFKYTRDYKGDFDNTDIKKFMDTYLSKELFQVQNMEVNEINSQETQFQNEEDQLSSIIEKLYKKGYSSEQIIFHTTDVLKKLSINSRNTSIYQKTKHL